jgi:hypothetical protein
MKLFLSHASADKVVVRQVGAALAPYVPDLWLDERELLPGDSLWGGIASAVTAADRVLVFVSGASSASRWVSRELNAFLAREDTADAPLVIPVILEGAAIPPFLADRVYVQFNGERWAQSLQALLKGVLRRHSIIVAGPRGALLHELDFASSALEPYRDATRAGDTLVVYDHRPFTDAARAMYDESTVYSDRDSVAALQLAWPRVFEFMAAVSPFVLQITYSYFKGQGVTSDWAARLLRRVWRLVVLSLFNQLATLLPHPRMQELAIFAGSTLEALSDIKKRERVPRHYGVSLLTEAWLDDLNLSFKDCYDLGFHGVTREGGARIYNVSHVLMPQSVVRESSLTRFRGIAPEAEFTSYTWVEYAPAVHHCSCGSGLCIL